MEAQLFLKLVLWLVEPSSEPLTDVELARLQNSGLFETLALFFTMLGDSVCPFAYCVSAMRVALHIPETENTGRHET